MAQDAQWTEQQEIRMTITKFTRDLPFLEAHIPPADSDDDEPSWLYFGVSEKHEDYHGAYFSSDYDNWKSLILDCRLDRDVESAIDELSPDDIPEGYEVKIPEHGYDYPDLEDGLVGEFIETEEEDDDDDTTKKEEEEEEKKKIPAAAAAAEEEKEPKSSTNTIRKVKDIYKLAVYRVRVNMVKKPKKKGRTPSNTDGANKKQKVN